LIKKGKIIKDIWSRAAMNADLEIDIKGIDPLASFKLNIKNWNVGLTFFIKEMLKNNILASDRCYANYMHSKNLIIKYEIAYFEVFKKISILEKNNKLAQSLEGPVKQIDFKRLTN